MFAKQTRSGVAVSKEGFFLYRVSGSRAPYSKARQGKPSHVTFGAQVSLVIALLWRRRAPLGCLGSERASRGLP